MAAHGYQCSAPQLFVCLFQKLKHVLTNTGGTDIIKPQLNDTGQFCLGLKQ